MNLRPKYRPRLTTRRYSFVKTKPRRSVIRKEALCPNVTARVRSKKRIHTREKSNKAVAGHATGRRLNRLPEWSDPKSYITKGGRHRLKGKDYQKLRWAAYQRSWRGTEGPSCECGCGKRAWWSLPPDLGELSHNEHGARKSDELHRVKWMRHECHMKSHNAGGKPIAIRKRDIL